MNRKKQKSTYDEFIESMTPKQRKKFEEEYKDLLISEMLIAAMKQDNISVRELAKEAGISPTIIQGIRSGTRENVAFNSVLKILSALGYKLRAEKEDRGISFTLCI